MAGTTLVLHAGLAASALAVALTVVSGAAVASQQAAGAADNAAVAAADSLSGAATGDPCARAGEVAAAAGARVTECTSDGFEVVVSVVVGYSGLPAQGIARAGPPRDFP